MTSKVLTMIRRHQARGLMLFVVATLSGCASHEDAPEPVVIEEPKEPEPISLLLACAPASSDRAFTRLADPIVQLNNAGSYRNITNFRVIAQTKDGNNVIITDSWVDNPGVVKDNTTSRFYHSGYCSMTEGVNACLVYAKADDATPPDGVSKKVYNGSLKPEIAMIPTYVSSTRRLSFDLNPIIEDATVGDDGVPAEAWTLADALTAIVDESHNEGNTLVWRTSTNVILRNLFQRFTNSSADLPGSAASVKQWMLSLSAAADSYLTNPPSSLGEDDKTLLGIIKEKADAKAATVTVNYPRDLNLPDGAAALRWAVVEKQVGEETVKEQKFVPQMHTTTLDNINSVSRFVYPPALYYFVDSSIWTSTEKVEDTSYKSKTTWQGIGNTAVQSLFKGGPTVLSSTKSVAVADPLQYAVAHLTMEVKAGAASLPYGVENSTIDISKLTLKGVIIGGQRSVGYDFKPISDSQYDINFVYDSQVSSSIPLTTTGDTYNTLALQSYDGEKVNIILEFQYSGDTGFKCLNGYVYPGTRFYLVGELDPSQGVPLEELADEEKAELKKRVFTQDHTTAIQLTVNSLEKAYNVLPSLLSNSLEIGVMITPQWFSATPSGPVVMD